MDLLTVDPITLKARPSWLVNAVDELIEKIRHKNIWDICDFAIEVWSRKNPTEYKEFIEFQKRYRANRKNQYASTKNKWMRELVNVPQEITYILNKVAFDKIEEYGTQKFWKDFAKKYPGFRNGDKL